jgi:glycosyltransferase involved in cell wall biosynthesis
MNAERIPSPMLFMIIKPSESPVYLHAMKHCKYLGCSAPEDWHLTEKHNYRSKSVRVIHGIDEKISVGLPGFRYKYKIKTKYMFLSCGGFWPNKAMNELVKVFNDVGRNDTTLVLTGYDNRHNIMPVESEFVKPMMIEDRDEVLSAIHDADLYIMHSFSEGFGLVLLEAMLNKTPWASRKIAGANLMQEFGFTYTRDTELMNYIIDFNKVSESKIEESYEYVTLNHMIKNTVNDIMRLT